MTNSRAEPEGRLNLDGEVVDEIIREEVARINPDVLQVDEDIFNDQASEDY